MTEFSSEHVLKKSLSKKFLMMMLAALISSTGTAEDPSSGNSGMNIDLIVGGIIGIIAVITIQHSS